MILTAGRRPFRELNAEIRAALETEKTVRVEDVNGQRYMGAAMDKGKTLEIHGTPGNDMAAYLNGGTVEVTGKDGKVAIKSVRACKKCGEQID